MRKLYFSGFCLDGEKELFSEYIIENDYTISGFSYGAIQALEFAFNSAMMDIRIDLIQLFSPAFFNQKSDKYKRLQLIYFNKDQDKYCENFLENCGLKKEYKDKFFKMGTAEELSELLNYKWDQNKLQMLIDNGTKIEVYLGENDKIIDSKQALDFFVNYSDLYYIKDKGHIL